MISLMIALNSKVNIGAPFERFEKIKKNIFQEQFLQLNDFFISKISQFSSGIVSASFEISLN